MASKKFRGKPCVYCGGRCLSAEVEHVFARELFPRLSRGNLPKVPSCSACNRKKSALEQYLATMLPFGGKHAGAAEHLASTAPRRLAKNLKLHRKLAQERHMVLVPGPDGFLEARIALPFDTEVFTQYLGLATRGLVWFHWQEIVPEDAAVSANCLSSAGEIAFQRFFEGRSGILDEQLGRGLVRYRGARAPAPGVSAWEYEIYGGVSLGGDPEDPISEATRVGVIVLPRVAIKPGMVFDDILGLPKSQGTVA